MSYPAIDTRVGTTLEWRQESAFGRYYELKAGNTVYGALEFVKRFGSLAEGRTAAGEWTFKRRGMMSPQVSAWRKGSEDDVALYRPNWNSSKGELTLAGGETLTFRSESFWGKDWVLARKEGEALAQFSTHGLMKHESDVTLEPAGAARADLPLLLTFCWYLLLLYREDQAAAAVVISG